MSKVITRRGMLKKFAAGSGTLVGQGLVFSQETPIQIAGRPVEIALTPVSSQTARITIQAIENGHVQALPIDGALVKENGAAGRALRTLVHSRTVKCGELTVKVSSNPLTIRVEGKGGRLVQELTSDANTGNLSFQTGESPVLGLGQADHSSIAAARSIEWAADREVTTGYAWGKVPIQFIIGTSGWAMYIHHRWALRLDWGKRRVPASEPSGIAAAGCVRHRSQRACGDSG